MAGYISNYNVLGAKLPDTSKSGVDQFHKFSPRFKGLITFKDKVNGLNMIDAFSEGIVEYTKLPPYHLGNLIGVAEINEKPTSIMYFKVGSLNGRTVGTLNFEKILDWNTIGKFIKISGVTFPYVECKDQAQQDEILAEIIQPGWGVIFPSNAEAHNIPSREVRLEANKNGELMPQAVDK